jgi:hypothetical protein
MYVGQEDVQFVQSNEPIVIPFQYPVAITATHHSGDNDSEGPATRQMGT